ncbi:hypothetical protein L2E82_39920 [Cichorium intybus]|uniref:Uncharacterized protein n=1 Tax=Cichorium intybus TaxID=13427 RepID=A0ACB9AK66_CICIN|nr:hypothetical protein L2E82_39920 [Cichorium intybus]
METAEEGQNRMKLIKLVDEGEEDRVNALPDCLLIEILTRLPSTADAIRTDYSQTEFLPNPNARSDFVSFVDKALTQCRQSKLKKFEVSTRYHFTSYDNRFDSQFNNWVRYAFSYNVEVTSSFGVWRALFINGKASIHDFVILVMALSSQAFDLLSFYLLQEVVVMGKDDSGSSEVKTTTLHPAYTVTNIQTKIRTLDGTKVTYSSWTKLFRLHAKAYKVLDHIDDTPAPKETDPTYLQWVEIDALVLQWIYSTLSDELMVRILESDTTAQEAWNKLKANFLNNKGSRAAALEQEFSNLTLAASSSMEAYCQKLKDLADQLGDVDNPVTEARLVLQMVRGLPPEFDVVGAYINQSSPSWETARSMLQLEQHRQTARQNQTHTVLAAPTSVDQSSPNATAGQRSQTPSNNNYSGRGAGSRGRGSTTRGRGRSFRGRGGRGHQNWNHGNQWHQQSWNSSQPWNPPPSPYPSYGPSQSTNHWANHTYGSSPVFEPTTQQGPTGPPSMQPSGPMPTSSPQFAGYSDYNPSDLAQTMQQVHLNSNDPSWYMDSGASTHLTSDQGKLSSSMTTSPVTSIFVGNGSSIPIHGSGHASFTTPSHSYALKNILFTPSIIKNLLSVRKFTIDNQTSVEFDPYGFSIKDLKTGDLLSRHDSTGDLYPFTTPSSASALLATSHDRWHARLGHPGAPVLDLLRSKFSISCNKPTTSSLCNACQLSKHTRLPFYDSQSVTYAPFDIIHCDLWTSPVLSKTGYKYYMEPEFPLDQLFFINSCISNMTLEGCIMNPSGAISWKNLRRLCMSTMKTDEDLIENILSGSPLLETLVLDRCYGYRLIGITSKSVKKFVLSGYSDPEDEFDLDNIIEINAPNILSLTIDGTLLLWKVLLVNVSSLIEAELDYEKLGYFETMRKESLLKGFILNLRHVKELRIGGFCSKVVSHLKANGFVFPSNIKLPDVKSDSSDSDSDW